jgi:hypothetical protein
MVGIQGVDGPLFTNPSSGVDAALQSLQNFGTVPGLQQNIRCIKAAYVIYW